MWDYGGQLVYLLKLWSGDSEFSCFDKSMLSGYNIFVMKRASSSARFSFSVRHDHVSMLCSLMS